MHESGDNYLDTRRSDEGKKTAHALCLKADVVLENFRPDIMGRMGLDYESLTTQSSRLVYASISGFGPDGPDASLGAFDLTIQGVGGYMSITGSRDGAPVKLGTSAFDMLAGMNCQTAIVAALLHRERTGKGQRITTSLLESEIAFLANAALEYLMTGQEPQKWGSEHAQQVPYKAFQTKDGWAVIGAGFQNFFESFVKILGLPELAQQAKFANMVGRVVNRGELYAILDEEVLKWSTTDIIARLEAAGVPCSPVNNMQQVFANRQVMHRGMQMALNHERYGEVPTLGPAARYTGFDITEGWKAPPVLGEHTEEVLQQWLG